MSKTKSNMVLIFDFDIVSETPLVSIGDFGSLFLGCTRKPKSLRKSYFSSSSLAKTSEKCFPALLRQTSKQQGANKTL
jgi:hypothetical protein